MEATEECARIRPDWAIEQGPAFSVSELLILLNSPLGYIWIGCVVLALLCRRLVSGGLLVLATLATLILWPSKYTVDDDLWLGYLGGCIGTQNATIGALLLGLLYGLLLCLLPLIKALPKRT